LARARLRGTRPAVADEEDVALSAFDSFYRRAERGQFPQVADRNDLWQLLFVITVRKAISHGRRQRRRPGGELTLSDLEPRGADKLLDREPTPELAAQVADECRRLLGCLGDGVLRSVAIYKMKGCTNDEIAVKLGCARPTVERKLRRIRSLWAGERGR
jgi:DNA-directed RNA polymerase specialized sigma24 family protein